MVTIAKPEITLTTAASKCIMKFTAQENPYSLLAHEPNISITQLQTIKCPVLVIGGDHDVIRPRHTMLIAESIPRSDLWILPNSGHATPVVYKNLFNEVVNGFFKNPYRKIEGLKRLNRNSD